MYIFASKCSSVINKQKVTCVAASIIVCPTVNMLAALNFHAVRISSWNRA